jgi:hypothetical protein
VGEARTGDDGGVAERKHVYAGDHDYAQTGELRGASFFLVDLAGARFRDCELVDVRFADCVVSDVRIGGAIERLVVNDVDVTDYVEGVLDERYPERVQVRALRAATTPRIEEVRALWSTLEQRWADTTARAERLPEPALHERVDDEWSFVETLRHLTFATDAWVSRTILDEERPYHRLGYPAGGYSAADAAAIGIDLDAQPSYAEVREARLSRQSVVGAVLAELTDADLLRLCERNPAPGYPEEPVAVHRCLRVVMNEECEHRRYAERDLAVLEARSR